jgi:hypothetical protein
VARTSRVVANDNVVVGMENEDMTEEEDSKGNHCNASEKACGCTLVRCLILTQNRIHLTLASVAVSVSVKVIAVVILVCQRQLYYL